MALDKFINELKVQKLLPKLSVESIDDIEKGVTKYIARLIDTFAEKEVLFTIKQIVKVGSFYEKTKLRDPDEFDFLCELKGNFITEVGCPGNSCSAHVKDTGVNISDKDRGMVIEGNLASKPVFSRFQGLLKSCIYEALHDDNDLQVLQCKYGQLTCIPVYKGSGPNTEVHLIWDKYVTSDDDRPFSLPISVDISVCLECPDSLLSKWSDHIATNHYSIGSNQLPRPILVVPSPSRMKFCEMSHSFEYHVCWRISFAPIEVHLMKNLPESHRLSYCVLKSLCKQTENPTADGLGHDPVLRSISSYMLKNAVLHHNATCDGDQTDKCLEAIIDYLLNCCEEKFLPAFFFPKLNLWKSHSKTGEVKPPFRILVRLREFLFNEIYAKSKDEMIFEDVWWDVLYMQKFFGDYDSEDLRILTPQLPMVKEYPPPSVIVKHNDSP